MKRHNHIQQMTLGVAISLSTGISSGFEISLSSRGGSAPNILFLLADDQRWDAVGFAGNPVIQTPHLDQLAQRATVFENTFTTTSICMTSRASILTGQYARTHGVNDFYTVLSDEQMSKTYPGLMREADYYTGFIGKCSCPPKTKYTAEFWRLV